MAKKLPEEAPPRQSVDVALPWDVQAHRVDTIRRLQATQKGIARALEALTEPSSSERDVEAAMEWGDAIWAACKGHDLRHLARMEFLEYLNNAAIQVREKRGTLPELAERVFSTCALHGWTQYWARLWVDRASGKTQELLRKAISAWIDGAQWRREDGAPILELLRCAGLSDGALRLEYLKKQWLQWRAGGPNAKLLANLFPYEKGTRPIAASTAVRTVRPGPKPTKVMLPIETARRLVDREKHIEEMADNLKAGLLPGVKRDVLIKMLTKRDRNS